MKKHLLVNVISQPEKASSLSLSDWDTVIRQARSIDMLARLCSKLKRAGVLESLPNEPVRHLLWAETVTRKHTIAIKSEVDGLCKTLSSLKSSSFLSAPLVLLKGAAYCCGQLPPSDGRLFSDIDILLPKSLLPEAEKLLDSDGWLATHLDEYDQKYYRKWMHELPPMKHAQRQTELDVHHAIVPDTAKVSPSSAEILSKITPINERLNLYRLCNEDLILHSATHLFFDGEMQHGLRDLEDIDSLLREYCKGTDDFQALLERAGVLQLTYPLFYALYYCRRWLKTPIPEAILKQSEQLSGISLPKKVLMRELFDRGLLPDHRTCRDSWTGLARWCLYIRSHYLKMPMHLLIPHLFYKSFIGPVKKRIGESKAEKAKTLDELLEEKKAGLR